MHLVILLFALFASLFTLQKDTLSYTEPFFLVGARMTFSGIILLLYLFFYKRQHFRLKAEHLKHFAMLAISGIYLTNICEIWAIKHMVSSKACLVYSLSPFLAALIAYFVIKERLESKKWLGMLIGFIGLIPILFAQTQTEIATGTLLIFTLPELSILGAVVCSVYGWIMLKKLMQADYSPLMANGVTMTIGGLLALGHSYLSNESWQPFPVSHWQPFLLNSLVMCVISNLICYNLYGYLLKRFTATFMSFSGLITPFFASLFGYLFLNEIITWHFFASIGLFFIGLMIFYHEEIRRGQGFKVLSDDNLDERPDEA